MLLIACYLPFGTLPHGDINPGARALPFFIGLCFSSTLKLTSWPARLGFRVWAFRCLGFGVQAHCLPTYHCVHFKAESLNSDSLNHKSEEVVRLLRDSNIP